MSVIERLVARLALGSFEAVEATKRRSTRILAAAGAVLITTGMWLVHLSNPSLIFDHHGALGELVYVLVLIPPFLAGVSIGYLLFPEIEKPIATGPGPMSGYLQREKAEKRWKIIVTAGMLSAVNLFCMLFTSRSV